MSDLFETVTELLVSKDTEAVLKGVELVETSKNVELNNKLSKGLTVEDSQVFVGTDSIFATSETPQKSFALACLVPIISPKLAGQITRLGLWENHTLQPYLEQLLNRLKKYSNLTHLWLCYDRLTELPETVGQLSNLTHLWLYNNRLTELPETITQLSNLTHLWLYNNRLTELPETVGQLSNLTSLKLSNNRLTELPETITQLSNLTHLRLDGNRLGLTETPEVITKFLDSIPNTNY